MNEKELKQVMGELIFIPRKQLIEVLLSLQFEKKQLIKYLEDKINGVNKVLKIEQSEEAQGYLLTKKIAYQDILERVKSGKYE